MKVIRRFRFQLAPLVDLLLIIVFAQFMEIRDVANRESIAEQSRVTELESQLADSRSQLASVQQQNESITRQTKLAITSIAESFRMDNIPPAEIDAMIGDGQADLSPIVQQISSEVAEASPEEVVRFLIGHAELLKRAEIWNLHANAQREVLLSAGSQTTTIRLERGGQDARTREVEDQLFAAYKQLPQPKGLVVILVSYSPDAIAGVYQPMIDGMPKAVERMRMDLPATRFEYTVLGTTPLPDALR